MNPSTSKFCVWAGCVRRIGEITSVHGTVIESLNWRDELKNLGICERITQNEERDDVDWIRRVQLRKHVGILVYTTANIPVILVITYQLYSLLISDLLVL